MGHSTARFLLVLLASLAIGAAVAAGQTVVFDPGATTVASYSGDVEVSSGELRVTDDRIHVQDNGRSSGSEFLRVGDDTFFTDVDTSNTLGLYGNSDSTTGTLQLGSGGAQVTGQSDGDIAIGAPTLDIGSNDIENIGNLWWAMVSLDSGQWQDSEGGSGSISVPGSGSTNCDSANQTCIRYDGSGQWTVSFEAPNRMDDDWWSNAAPGGLCFGFSAGDNEGDNTGWNQGMRSVQTDGNGHCYVNAQMDDCVEGFVYDTSTSSHDFYGVACWDPS